MCLLIAGKSNEIRGALLNTDGLMADIFKSNPDGLGAMYTTSKNKLRTPKILPNNLGECLAFIRQLPDDDRNMALHWRYRTHGDTNLENCHPYPVVAGKIALMHNGILSQGNNADKTKSDTWHYIADVVRPMLAEYPKLFTNKAWMSLVEDDISSGNRFAIMDNEGDLVILNKHTGVQHGDLWFSNTYAWSPELLIQGYAKPTKYKSGRWNSLWDSDDAYDDWYGKGSYAGNVKRIPTTSAGLPVLPAPKAADEIVAGPLDLTEDEVWEALRSCDPHGLCNLLLESPLLVLHMLMRECEFVPSVPDPAEISDRYSERDEIIVKALVDQTYIPLVDIIRLGDAAAHHVAEVICWYGDWVGKAAEDIPRTGGTASAEIIDILAKECPDMVKPATKKLTLVETPIMIATREAVAAHQTDADRESKIAQREDAIAFLEGEGGADDELEDVKEELAALELELDNLQEEAAETNDIHTTA